MFDWILGLFLTVWYIEEGQTTQRPKEKSTKGQTTIYKTYT